MLCTLKTTAVKIGSKRIKSYGEFSKIKDAHSGKSKALLKEIKT
jgi:hypothetical protein